MLGQTAEQINSGWPGIRPRGPSGASRSIRGNLGGEWVRGPEKNCERELRQRSGWLVEVAGTGKFDIGVLREVDRCPSST